MRTSDQQTVTINRVRAKDYGALDEALYDANDVYRRSWASEQFYWITDAVQHHLAHSEPYRRLALGTGFDISMLKTRSDFGRIPLLSSGSFKRGLFEYNEPGIKLCTSSGTMGSKSVVPRDGRTLERFVGSIANSLREFLGHNDLQRGYVLGPPQEQAGDLWFSYSLSLTEMFNDVDYFVDDDVFSPERLYVALAERQVATNAEPVIAGPPSLFMTFFDWFDENGMRTLALGNANAWVITAGGWKKASSEAVDPTEFKQRAAACLGIATDRVRDIFNMVELNTILFECEHGSKHVPPWLWVSARDARDLSVVPDGDVGLLAYVDPTPVSYPGFVLSDDLGAVLHTPCRCGRLGSRVHLERRLETIEERGCGLKMERYATGGKNVAA